MKSLTPKHPIFTKKIKVMVKKYDGVKVKKMKPEFESK